MEIFVDNLRNALLRGNTSLEKVRSLAEGGLVLQVIVTILLAFLVGRSGGAYPGVPCSLALMTVLMMRGKGNIYALPLAVLGMFSVQGANYGFWGEAVILSLCTLLFFTLYKKRISLTSRALISGVMSIGSKVLLYMWTGRLFLYDGLAVALELLLLFTFTYVFYSFFEMLVGGESEGKSEAEIIAVFAAVMILASTGIKVGTAIPFSVTYFSGLLIPLFIGHRRGSMQGGMAGMVGGVLIVVITGAAPDLIGIFGFCGIVAGVFRKQSRAFTSICFASAALIFGLLKGLPTMYFSLYEPLSAALIFAMVPSRFVESLCSIIPISDEDGDREWTERKRAKKVLQNYRSAFEKLALCCGNPQYSNPAKDVMALQFKGLTKTLDSIIDDLTNPVGPVKRKRPQYTIRMGVSSFAKEKDISGDSYIFEALGGEEFLIALSDGMGKGERAAEESAITVNTLRDLLNAGFDVEVALRIINSILLLKSADEIFSTVDMGLFNRRTGRIKLFKIGAAATYIRRDNQVKTIKIPTLPIGIIEKIPVESVEFKVKRGDAIIIVSDGIADAGGGEGDPEWLENTIRSIRSRDPQTMADLIINKAVERYGLKERDDMTVLVGMVS